MDENPEIAYKIECNDFNIFYVGETKKTTEGSCL